ncbi:sacsin N-terminal ATP-binding-like domain-containing protein [Dietzia sp. B32]|uniref:sacsin N-terminal ATP-binding-like domain-containing protein n=1 Tax=Dietzia sp. B32 TaxID=2915130 RepID=UPI0021AE00F1|nr:helicase-related protein [Dietzia sp. B32]UVE94407.1 DEAD/DEAH box helicase family protein [Dietzia sp. B32]
MRNNEKVLLDTNSWRADPKLVSTLQSQFQQTLSAYRAQPELITEHANHEESIRTGGYAKRTLLELVQNAADALSNDPAEPFDEAHGRVEIVLDTENEVLYCANGGRPFTAEGLIAITMAHLSAKRGDEIGRFGLGFKSVLAVSSAPQVFSRSISFGFNTAKAQHELAKIIKAPRYPVLRTAVQLDPGAAFAEDPILAGLSSWATTIIKLPAASNIKRIDREIRDFVSEFLLFVHAVRTVRLRIVGENEFTTSHISRDLGDGRLRIEGHDGEGEDWWVLDRMHSPSREARHQVGEAVSRAEFKVTVAIPAEQKSLKTGQFWSYFPLQDKTSASALFNAPWSVNDDRTTLLHNDYNREILGTLAAMFVELLPRVITEQDPAVHLDYMPARGRETHGFGDELLTTHVPVLAADDQLIPDATGTLRSGSELRPLDFDVVFDAEVHRGWLTSPNTGDDVPHWRCYTTRTRMTRLRDLFSAGASFNLDAGAKDSKRALEQLPKRGLLSWLREWAEGSDPVSAANALHTVVRNGNLEGIQAARIIPTSEGLCSLADNRVVFLQREADLDIENAVFVDPVFLRQQGVEQILRDRGFRNLDPQAILTARIAKLTPRSPETDLAKLWDAALDLRPDTAARLMQREGASLVKVPTRDGDWAWPQQVLDLDVEIEGELTIRLLDRHRCVPEVAHRIGVVQEPIADFSVEDEPFFTQYQSWALEWINQHLAPGERPVEAVEFNHSEGPGPFSVLFMLRDSSAGSRLRETWTTGLLTLDDQPWTADDIESGRTFTLHSPSRWAVKAAGLVRSTRGHRPPSDVVAPSLVRYEPLLPLYKGPRKPMDSLSLPDELSDVPRHVFREMLESPVFPAPVDDEVLVEFVLAATRSAFANAIPASIPARVRRTLEARAPETVFIATNDEQADFLRSRERAFLRATPEDATDLVQLVGCRSFEESFSFSMIIEGTQSSEPVLDLFTGLRNQMGSQHLENVKLSRAEMIAKRVTTEDGVEDQPVPWHIDGFDFFVANEASEHQVLRFISEAFGLHFDNAQIDSILKVGLDHHLEQLRVRAKSAATDAERLDLYIGPDDLREALPSGLWSALAAQDLVDKRTSVADLFLTVYGSDSLKILADRFRAEGFKDVPREWAGLPAAITWVRRMGFDSKFAGQRNQPRPVEFVVPGAVELGPLHSYQKRISEELRVVLTQPSDAGPSQKAMVELPTGAGKTRVATQTALRLFVDEVLSGTILWIAQSAELCEQAVQTFEEVWRYIGDVRPLTIGRLWSSNKVHEPDTELSVIVATDAQLEEVIEKPEYEWLSKPTAVFIDEAHRAGDSTRYTRILNWLGVGGRNWERPLVGLSATPFKGSASEMKKATESLAARFGRKRLAAFESGAYAELVRIGVLAKVQHEILQGIEIPDSIQESHALSQSRPLIDKSLYEKIGRSEARMKILVEHILGQDPEWPILVFTPSVLSAQVLAASLRYRNVKAASVSGQTGRQERRDVIKRFKDGEIQVLANCDLLAQGFDAPGVRALYIARPTFSPSAYIQMAGRGLRGKGNGGKEECLIVDVADNWGAMNDFLGYREYEELWKEQRE